MALSISDLMRRHAFDDAFEKVRVGGRLVETMGDEFLGHLLGADARQFHLIKRLDRRQAGRPARLGIDFARGAHACSPRRLASATSHQTGARGIAADIAALP